MQTAEFLGPLTNVPVPPAERQRASADAIAGAPPGALDFAIQAQQQSRWCWAAVTASVADYFAAHGGPPALSQCELATQLLHFPCCVVPLPPPPPPFWKGNLPYLLGDALDATGHLGAPPIGQAIPFDDVKNEIANGKPVCCGIRWTGDPDGHYVVIMGCHDDKDQDVVVLDPLEDRTHNGIFPYEVFKNFIGGSWKTTYLTR